MMFIVIVFGCKKDLPEMNQPSTTNKSMDQIQAGPAFDWKTTRDISLKFTCKTTSYLLVESKSGVTYHKAMMYPGGSYSSKITIPAYETELLLIVNGVVSPVKINGSELTHDF